MIKGILLDKTLKFWSECELENHAEVSSADVDELLIRIVFEWEEYGDAMRGLDKRGRLCWKATPQLHERLADQERDARDDLRNI